ncbi:hypothetical protein [Paenisporosarcina cavernae]|uniref:Prolipoprotein diacylglyceryl transferase n=1 Tax=Paenisporosarcina cavernae TaxID=2320858 RepID=A0A385YRF3_9BACL|nr:hypothetical protein [Paenisporosarcina cavernae]AYC28980.1 hypothetical protein D3873_03490 [Paenisporosarcina cavernae]
MPVTDWFIIKSLTVPSSWIAVLFALIVTGVILWKRFGKETEDWYSDAAILFLLVWKLSIIVTDFNMVWNSPISILYFNGGETGLYLGLVAAIARVFYVLFQKGFAERELAAMLLGMIMVQSLYQFAMVALNDGSLWQKAVTVILFAALLYVTWIKAFWSHTWRVQLTMLFLLVHFVVAYAQPDGILQTPLYITAILALSSIAVLTLRENVRKQVEE